MNSSHHNDLVLVAVDAPLLRPLTYALPFGLDALAPGTRVHVPLGKRRVFGIVVDEDKGERPKGLRRIIQVLDLDEPAISSDVLTLARFISSYYRAPLGEVLRCALPPEADARIGVRLGLSPEARKLLDAALLSGLDEQTLTVLRLFVKGPRSRRALIRGGVSAHLLDRLETQALLQRHEVHSPQVPEQRFFAAQAGATVEALPAQATRMREVLALLLERGELDVDSLELEIPNARSVLTRLLQRDVLVERRAQVPLPSVDAIEEQARPPVVLSDEQHQALQRIVAAIDSNVYAPFLLHGVTASGKTEVYLRAAQRALEQGHSVLFLVPEIALAPQLLGRVRQRLGVEVEVLHSALPNAERSRRWQRVRNGEVRCVVGARSAIFAPLLRLGLIIVDEEHEASYKQDESPRYNARDAALVRGRENKCAVVLGSATPSLESYQRALDGHYGYLSLPHRVSGGTLPQVHIVSLAQQPSSSSPQPHDADSQVLTPQLQLALTQTLERGEQAILFLNRRGYAQFVLCLDCGKTVGCPNCSVTLTHHKARGRLLCHYCGYQIRPPSQCERCQGARVVLYGMGTERLEEVVRTLFPSARLARLDRDSTRRRGALLQVLRRFGAGEADILIGTQMLAKGHDYPGVTLVGVIAADVSLAVADFRAAERTYQLLAQVSGRAGRSSLLGQVIIQSFDTEHSVILAAQQHDFKGFADQELAERRTLGYPPYGRLALVRIEAREDEHAETAARTMLKLAAKQLGAGLEILGPAPAPLARLRGVVRYQLLIKAKQNKVLQNALGALESAHAQLKPQQTRLVFDVDPTLVL